MNKNIEKIFLGLLWLMTVSLAITFWMSINYGFNIFSGAHWTYLSSLQASRAQIKPGFYTSLIVALIIALCGLYFLVRPRFRKINFKNQPEKQTEQTPTVVVSQTSTDMVRPASPLMGQIKKDAPKQTFSTAQNTTIVNPAQQQTTLIENPLASEILNVFDTAGYIMKPCKKIGKIMSPVVALGYNETLWIAASNITPDIMMDAIGQIITIFEDTLGDSANDLKLHGCIISPQEDQNPNPDMIKLFENIDKFKEFMKDKRNTLPPEHDAELFEAISTYISTVINHIGKK